MDPLTQNFHFIGEKREAELRPGLGSPGHFPLVSFWLVIHVPVKSGRGFG